jgi:ferredoxin--NADP+ reductase
MTSIAIIGAGPAGCFTAQALLRELPQARIDILDQLPVPYGLVRYGVAPDHQGTKAVIRQFERLFERNDVAFFGNVRLGDDLTLTELRPLYDAVVLALGLSGDRRLGIPGEDLAGVYGSGALTRAWNDHPDATGPSPAIGKEVVIIGNGNVAIDLIRLLAKSGAEFDGSDFAPRHVSALAEAWPRRITVVGRGAAQAARFDPVMLRELGRLGNARITVQDMGPGDTGPVAEALAAIHGHGAEGAAHQIDFRFGWTPEALIGNDRVAFARFAFGTGGAGRLDLPCDTVLTAIGFQPGAPDEAPLVASEDGYIEDGLYATGWYRRGPRGTIPENRADAQAVAARIAADLAAAPTARSGRATLAARLPAAVPYEGWLRIDATERAASPSNRCRLKIADRAGMLAIAHTAGVQP